MFTAPTDAEWLLVYLPLSFFLTMIMMIELRTERIPNVLVLPAFLYLIVARCQIGPAPFNDYLVSMIFVAALCIGGAYAHNLIPAGWAKLTIVIAAGLAPWMGPVVAASSIAVVGLIIAVDKFRGPLHVTLHGSVILSTITAGVVGFTTLQSSFQIL